jgi:hypothetical protein
MPYEFLEAVEVDPFVFALLVELILAAETRGPNLD